MNASERLRALDEGYDTDINDALYDALPLIADVVEAAERVDTYYGPISTRHQEVRDALTALREHLKGGDE